MEFKLGLSLAILTINSGTTSRTRAASTVARQSRARASPRATRSCKRPPQKKLNVDATADKLQEALAQKLSDDEEADDDEADTDVAGCCSEKARQRER